MRKLLWRISTQFLYTNFGASISPTPSLPSTSLSKPFFLASTGSSAHSHPGSIEHLLCLSLLQSQERGRQEGKGQKSQHSHRSSQEHRAGKGKKKENQSHDFKQVFVLPRSPGRTQQPFSTPVWRLEILVS